MSSYDVHCEAHGLLLLAQCNLHFGEKNGVIDTIQTS